MAITTRFKIPIYGLELFVSVGDSIHEVIESIPESFRTPEEEGDDNCKGVSFCQHPKYAIGINLKYIDRGIVHHEIGHVCRAMLGDIGFKIDPNNDEPLAYLEDWVANKIDHFLTKISAEV